MKAINEKLQKNLDKILANDYWKQIYLEAPDGAKAYLEAGIFGIDKDISVNGEELVRKEIEPNMHKEDWEYLAGNYAGCEQQRRYFDEKAEQAKE